MNFKYELHVNGRRTRKNWWFEKAGHIIGDKNHYWIWHCAIPKLIAANYFTKEYYPCSECQEMPPEDFLRELKLHHILEKYELHD